MKKAPATRFERTYPWQLAKSGDHTQNRSLTELRLCRHSPLLYRARISTASPYVLDPVLIELAPSILAADFAHLADQVERATAGGGSVIHVDIMDGHFVPNLTVGPPLVKSLRQATRLPLDCHLMIEN